MAGGIHHVFARGNRRDDIYLDEADYRRYLATLGHVTRWKRWRCLAYCLMPNHVHLLLETPQANLADGMRPEAWPWSSHAGTIDRGSRPAWLDADRLLSHFDGLGGDALRHYVAITEIDDVEHDADRDGGQAAATVSRR